MALARSPWIALCLVVPLVSGTVPGMFQSEATHGCDEVPCPLWHAVHHGPEAKAIAHHLVLSPDGATVYVVGGTSTIETSTDLVTWALDVATGALLWSAVYDGGSSEHELSYHNVRAVALSPDGSRLMVAGSSHGTFGRGLDLVTIAYDAGTGQELWVDRFHGGPDSDDDTAVAMAVDRTGTFVVTAGAVHGRDGGRDGILIGHDLATGAKLWERPYSSPCFLASVLGLEATPASPAIFVGGLVSSCLSQSAPTPEDAGVAFVPTVWALDPATGDVLWQAQNDDPLLTLQSTVFFGALEVTDHHVVLASRLSNPRNPETDMDVLTMAVDLRGEVQWRARYDSVGNDDVLGLRSAPDGSRVYLFATSPALATTGEADQNQDIVVTAYDGSGTVVWTTRMDSSTTGLEVGGAMVGGEGSDSAALVEAALLESGARLAFGYTAWFQSLVPLVGPSGGNAHIVAVLDTSDGSLAAMRLDEPALRQYSFAAVHERADFVGIGSHRVGSDYHATFRRLSLDTTAPDLGLPAGFSREATSDSGAEVAYAAAATDDRDGAVTVACSPASGTVFPLGTTTVTCSAQDTYGNRASGSFDVRVEDTTPPLLDVPSGIRATATSTHGAAVDFDALAHDAVDGAVPVDCSHASGHTFPPGTTRVSCAAADARGNAGRAAFEVTVTYAWTGFQEPIAADGSSEFQHGRTVPVKVELAGPSASVTDAVIRLWVQTAGAEAPAMGRGTSSNTFEYDPDTGVYTFGWDTSTVPPGHHNLRVDLGDGTRNSVSLRIH